MKIPKEAKCVFKGVLFDTYQWPQKLYDGSSATFEMLSRKACVDVIATVGNKILILNEEQPNRKKHLSLIGGQIENNEIPIEAAVRELEEETGYKPKETILLNEYNTIPKIDYPEFLVVARDCKKITSQKLDSGEKVEVTLFEFEDFLKLAKNIDFPAPLPFRLEMIAALTNNEKKEELRILLFEK